jgi:hypothetical protein
VIVWPAIAGNGWDEELVRGNMGGVKKKTYFSV